MLVVKYLLAVWFVLSLLKLSGFCFSQPGWNSSRDLIEAAFEHEMAVGWSNTPAISDLSAYLTEYPRCCSVSSSGPFIETPILNAIFLRRFYSVRIKYPVADTARNQGMPFYESILIMDCCGEDVPDRYGMALSEPLPKGPAPIIKRSPRTKGPAY